MTKKVARNLARPLKSHYGEILKPVVSNRLSFHSDLFENWSAIIGSELAAICQPYRLSWPRLEKLESQEDAPLQATLFIICERFFVTELLHKKTLFLSAVNRFFGFPLINKISFYPQSYSYNLGSLEPPKPPQAALTVSKKDKAELNALLKPIQTKELRDILFEMGQTIYAKHMPKRSKARAKKKERDKE